MKRALPLGGIGALALVGLVWVTGFGTGRAVRVAYVPEVPQATAVAGLADGRTALKQADRSLRWKGKAYTTPADALKALRSDKTDIAFLDPATAIGAFVEKGDVVVLGNTSWSGSVLVARPNAGMLWVRDLSHRTVAVPAAEGTQDVLLRYQLALHGLRPEDREGDVKLEIVPCVKLVERFQKGDLDAACVPEPWGSRLQKETGAVVLAGSGELFNQGGYPAALVVARKDYVERHPDRARAAVRALSAMAKSLGEEPVAYAAVLARGIQKETAQEMPVATVEMALKRCRFAPGLTERDLRMYANLVTVAGYQKETPRLEGILWQ